MGGPALDSGTGPVDVCLSVVEEISGLMVAAALGEVKCTVMRAGPVWLIVRFIVMGTAGLWYFNRGRQFLQNFLERGSVLVLRRESRACTLVHSVRHGCRLQSPYGSSLPLVAILPPRVLILWRATVGWVN